MDRYLVCCDHLDAWFGTRDEALARYLELVVREREPRVYFDEPRFGMRLIMGKELERPLP